MSLNCPNCGIELGLRLAVLSLNESNFVAQLPSGVEPQSAALEPQNGGVEPQMPTVEPQLVTVEGVRTSKSKARYFYPDENFQVFWKVYPRKVGKASAFAKWRIAAREVEPQTIIDAAKRFAEAQRGVEAQFIPYPEKWLSHGRWEDEEIPVKRAGDIEPFDIEAHLARLDEEYG